MEPVRTIEGRIQVLDRADVDTDQIIPKQYLKRIERTRLRRVPVLRLAQGGPRARPGRPILVTGRNFGCGSSREHAVWALQDFGFQAVVAPSFADIFYGNCTKTGLLPVVLPDETVRALMEAERGDRRPRAPGRSTATAARCPFEINPDTRERLLEGLDEIALTLGDTRRHRPLRGRGHARRARSPHRCRLTADACSTAAAAARRSAADRRPRARSAPPSSARSSPAEREVVLDPRAGREDRQRQLLVQVRLRDRGAGGDHRRDRAGRWRWTRATTTAAARARRCRTTSRRSRAT